MNENNKQTFLQAANEWLCDQFAVSIQYVIVRTAAITYLADAKILLNPLPIDEGLSFHVDVDRILAGNLQLNGQSKTDVLQILERALKGEIELGGTTYTLPAEQNLDFFSEMTSSERWFSDLHIQVTGSRITNAVNIDFTAVDNALRSNDLPFDGLSDLIGWLGLSSPQQTHIAPAIKIRGNPPVDIMLDSSKLQDDVFSIVLHAHPEFDITSVRLAVRAAPGKALQGRRQIGSDIAWNVAEDGKRHGSVRIHLEHCDSAMAMLQIGSTTVRRQWFLDPVKARSGRLVATQSFDKDLKMIRQAVLESHDADKFEKGIAALGFLLGCSQAVQLETDSPDIILVTPGGKVVLIECTLRIADFSKKVGKLIDRCNSLSKIFKSAAHHAPVFGALVCGSPKDQIGSQAQVLEENSLFLVTRDELSQAFDRLRYPSDPDEILATAALRFSQNDMFRILSKASA